MFRHILHLVGASAVVLMMAACQPLADNPLIDPNEAERDTRLYGSWISAPAKDDPQYSILHVGPSNLPLTVGAAEPEKGLLQAWYIQMNKDTSEIGNPLSFFFVSSQSGPTWVASISEGLDFSIGHAAREDTSSTKRITDTEKKFWFLRYEVSGDTLKVWAVPPLLVVEQAIKAGELHGTVEHNDKGEPTAIHLTDSTEVLKKYFDAHWQELFPGELALTYTRVAVPPAR